jgi:hypothetical protein
MSCDRSSGHTHRAGRSKRAVACQAGKESAPTYISTLTSWLPNPSLKICDSCDNSLDVLPIVSGRALTYRYFDVWGAASPARAAAMLFGQSMAGDQRAQAPQSRRSVSVPAKGYDNEHVCVEDDV